MSLQRIQANFSRAAEEYDARAQFQQRETARVLDAALMLLPEQARIADIGCGTGWFAEMARPKRPDWKILGIDIAPGMCAQAAERCTAIQADAVALPLADASCDAVVSSLCLQWVDALNLGMAEIARVLKPGGRAMIASLGEESLPQLRRAAEETGLPLGLLAMKPAAEYRVAIAQAGLGTVLFRQENGVEYYPTLEALLNSMRQIGAGNPAGSGGLMGAKRWKAMLKTYEQWRTPQGLPASWDHLFMVVHKPR